MKLKNQWGLLLIASIMGGTFWYVFRGQTMKELAAATRGVQPAYLALGLFLMLLYVGCEALCSRMVLTRLEGRAIRFRQCLGYSFTGFYFSSVTPSATGGQPAQVYYMARDGIAGAHAALDMLVVSACYQLGTIFYAAAALLANLSLFSGLGLGMRILFLTGGGVALVLTVGLLLLMFAPRAAAKLMDWLLRLRVALRMVRDKEEAALRMVRQMEEYSSGAEYLRRRPMLMLSLLGLTILQLTALYLVPYMVYLALGLHGVPVITVVGMQAVLTLAVSGLPLPGAVGATEGGFLHVFAVTFGSGLVAPAMALSRGISFYAFLIVSGLVTLAVHLGGRKKARTKQALAAPASKKTPELTV